MTWIEKINTELRITTGDGDVYIPNWLNAVKQKEFNVSEFEFIEVSGTFVHRSKAKGNRYAIEIYFQGERHLAEAANFEKSTDDPRAWKIDHPFYGAITVQPLSLSFDNTAYNVTKITGTVVETITENNPKGKIDAADFVLLSKATLDGLAINAYVNTVIPKAKDVKQLTANVKKMYSLAIPNINLDIDASAYFKAFTSALSAIITLISAPFQAMTLVSDFINAAIITAQSVQVRVSVLTDQFNGLRSIILGLSSSSSPEFDRNAKKNYENNAGLVVSAACASAVTEFDYKNRLEVIDMIDKLLALYNQYILDLDSFQANTFSEKESYFPDPNTLFQLNLLINTTVSSLFTIGLGTKQERIIYTEQDTNLILLAHRIYGLNQDDSTILLLKENLRIRFHLNIQQFYWAQLSID